MTKIISFVAGPSAGKSTMAGQLFGHMKQKRLNVEYVQEFAKDLTWKRSISLDDQLYVLGNQHNRLYTLLGQVDYVVTDSPLFLSLHYAEKSLKKYQNSSDVKKAIEDLVLAVSDQLDETIYFVDRAERKFVQAGRNQNEAESKLIDSSVIDLLKKHAKPFKVISNIKEVIKDLNV